MLLGQVGGQGFGGFLLLRQGSGQGGLLLRQGGHILGQSGLFFRQGGHILSQSGLFFRQGGYVLGQRGLFLRQGGHILGQRIDVLRQGCLFLRQGGHVGGQGFSDLLFFRQGRGQSIFFFRQGSYVLRQLLIFFCQGGHIGGQGFIVLFLCGQGFLGFRGLGGNLRPQGFLRGHQLGGQVLIIRLGLFQGLSFGGQLAFRFLQGGGEDSYLLGQLGMIFLFLGESGFHIRQGFLQGGFRVFADAGLHDGGEGFLRLLQGFSQGEIQGFHQGFILSLLGQGILGGLQIFL